MEKVKVYPSAEELKTVNSCLPCTEEGCNSIFKSESNLTLHLTKTHQKRFEYDNVNKEFHCPNEDCVYGDEKFFKTLKLLKQHYLKVHANKTFKCENCNKGFATFNFKERHKDYCGITFKCCECQSSYLSYESLLTHARRKNHRILGKASYNLQISSNVNKSNSCSDVKTYKNGPCILPKTSTSLQLLNVVPIVMKNMSVSHKSSQTETCCESPELISKHTQVIKNVSEQSSKQSQTLLLRKCCSSAETQTNNNYSSKRPKLSNSSVANGIQAIADNVVTLKDIKTQTNLVESLTKSCNTSFDLEGIELVCNIPRSSSSTQTNAMPVELLYSTSTSTHDSTHTDTSDLNFEFIHSSSQTCFNDDMSLFDSCSFFNCNTETQTDFMLDTNMLNYDDCYSNTHTQTTNSLNLDQQIMQLDETCSKPYDDLLFNTIDTQTALDDIVRSVESQTMLHSFLTCRDMASMETQTDIDFKMLLEEINA